LTHQTGFTLTQDASNDDGGVPGRGPLRPVSVFCIAEGFDLKALKARPLRLQTALAPGAQAHILSTHLRQRA
jgi:hypothetical protein